MFNQLTAETKLQDIRLNASYKALLASVFPDRGQQLVNAQLAWIKFRDLNCNFYDNPGGGQMARLEANGSYMRMTAERAQELSRLRK